MLLSVAGLEEPVDVTGTGNAGIYHSAQNPFKRRQFEAVAHRSAAILTAAGRGPTFPASPGSKPGFSREAGRDRFVPVVPDSLPTPRFRRAGGNVRPLLEV